MPEPKRPLKVFLCHAHADRDPVRGLYTRLTQDGVDAWLDKAKLLPGQDWELEIRKAVREADVVVVCLSKQFNQAGFRQKEVRLALDTAMEKPEGEIFIIPARLEECDNLESLRKWHWVDLFEDDGYEMLMRALRARADKIGATLQIMEKNLSKNVISPVKKVPKVSHQLPNTEKIGDSDFDGFIVIAIIFAGIVVSTQLSTQPRPLMQVLYDLVRWQYFGIFAIIWVGVGCLWVEKWQSLLLRISKLITKPIISIKDKEPNDPPLYFRFLLEELALSNRFESKWINAQRDRIFDPKNPLSSIGYLISLALFVFFLFADAIVVTIILELMGTISFTSVPEILQRLDIAFLGGVVFTVLTSVWTLVELLGTGGVIASDSMTVAQKTLYKWIAGITIFISAVLMFSLSAQRLIKVDFLAATSATDMILSFVSYGLLAVNTFLSAVLVFQPATSGFLVVLIYLLFPVIPVFAFFADVVWRLVYIVVDIALWILFTPIMVIPYGIRKIFGLISNTAKN